MKKVLSLLLCALLLLPCAALADATATDLADTADVLVCNGGSFCLAVCADGTVLGWGDGRHGELGIAARKEYYRPVECATGLDGRQIRDIQGGNNNTVYLLKDGTVYTSGIASHGAQGCGVSKKSNNVPTQVPGLTGIVQIGAGFGQCAALDSDGHVWCWGRSNYGQVGDGSKTDRWKPVQLSLENIVQVACGGKHCIALDSEGRLWGWGQNEKGELGSRKNGKAITSPRVITEAADIDIAAIAAGTETIFLLDTEGRVWSMGWNRYYQLGCESFTGPCSETPVQVSIPEPVREVCAYSSHVMAITTSGNVYIWGNTSHGQLGTGVTTTRSMPVLSWDRGNAVSGSVGSLVVTMYTTDGDVIVTGFNRRGQLGYKTGRECRFWKANGVNLYTSTVVEAWSVQ